VLGDTGRVGEAVAIHRQLADATNDKGEAVRVLDDGAKIAWRKGQRDQSVALWRRAVEIDPTSSIAFTNLANGLQLMNRRDEARVDFAKAIELDPKNSAAWLSESALMILAGEFRGARQRLELALTHNPDHPALMGTLARLLSTCPEDGVRDGVKALQLAQRALAIDNKLEHAETAAMALAEMGQFEQAIRYQRSLAQQAQQRGERQSVIRLLGTLRTFEQRRPIRAYT
jgi:tetratricopeptide (TPR) repeat protein